MKFSKIISFPLFLFFFSCLQTPMQDARFLFRDGKIPENLQRHANQLHSLRRTDQSFIRRNLRDKRDGKLLEVAVIDNGVEYTHPDLIDKVIFDVDPQTKRIIGAGFDAMANDNFASPVVFNSKIFDR